jgi:uncharacterized protein (DUF1800 family)
VYRESDVRKAAEVLSGWQNAMPVNIPFDELAPNLDAFGFDEDTLLPRGKVKGSPENASQHNNDVKTFSDRLGGLSVTPDTTLMPNGNPTQESAIDEIRQLIDIIYAQTETPLNICRRIYRFFVWAPHTNAEAAAIEPVIAEMANTLIANDYKLLPVVKELLKSQHFYEMVDGDINVSDANFGALIKSPIDLSLGVLRFFELTIPDMTADPDTFYERTSRILTVIGKDRQGMAFYEPFDVAGYEAYHQYPIYHRAWITPNTLGNRYAFIRGVITGIDGMGDESIFNTLDIRAYIQANFNDVAGDVRQLIPKIASYLLPFISNLTFDTAVDETDSSLHAERLELFLEKMFEDVLGEMEWSDYWNNRPEEYADIRRALQNLLNAMLQTPEYQLA